MSVLGSSACCWTDIAHSGSILTVAPEDSQSPLVPVIAPVSLLFPCGMCMLNGETLQAGGWWGVRAGESHLKRVLLNHVSVIPL